NPNERIVDRMLRSMNQSVSPCEDFHKYSSGRYREGVDGRSDYSLVDAMEEQISPKFHHLFEKLKNRSHKKGSMKEKLFRLYNSCEAARRENRSSNIFLDVMRPGVNLSWPLYMPEGKKFPHEQFRWLDTLARLYRYGLRNFLFDVSLRMDSEDNPNYMYVIERAHLSLPGRFINSKIEKIRAWGVPSDAINELELTIYILMRSDSVNYPGNYRMSLQELKIEHEIDLIDFFRVAFDREIDPNTKMLVDLGYLIGLVDTLKYSGYTETAASYLMERFGTFMMAYRDNTKHQCVVAVRTSMKAATEQLYEEHILGESKELESQVQRVFEVIKKQFSQRLQANRLNLSTSYISKLQNKLETTTLTLGVLPKKKDLQKSDNYLYDKLEFDIDDDFATMQMKAMDVLGKSENLFPDKLDKEIADVTHPGHTITFGNRSTIFIPYDLLVEPFFSTQIHDVFKVSMLGYIIAENVFKALYPAYIEFDCKHYKEFIDLLDDKHLYWDRSQCYSRLQVDNYNWWGLHLVLVNIVHDAYFSPNSGFSQAQPDFTSLSLKQLFFLNIAQNIAATNSYWKPGLSAPSVPGMFPRKYIYNPVFKMPTYAEAFNC
ncbi:hypothetical protein KR032_009710, partial [Drosophila birchii]